MNSLNKVLYVVLFIAATVSAQTKRIQVISELTKLPIPNVEVYDGFSLLGKSDVNGFLDINTGESNYLHTIEEDFQDAFIKTADLQEKVILVKNKPIQLDEVFVGKKEKIKINKVLNRIQDNIGCCIPWGEKGNKNQYKLPPFFKLANGLLMEADTLHYLSGLVKYNKGKWSSIDKKFRLVKNFKHTIVKKNNQITEAGNIYSIDKKEIKIHNLLTMPYTIDKESELSENILKNRKNYNYVVTDIRDFYKVEFVSKKKTPLGLYGYLIVDKKDYEIYEFKAHLPASNEYSDDLNKPQRYHLSRAEYYTKYQKGENGSYQMICAYAYKQFEQLEGNFKGKKFLYHSKIEACDNDKNAEFVDFDLFKYELK